MDEQSHLPTFISTVLTVIIAVIVVAAVFVPLIDDFKKTAGDKVTFHNETAYGEYGAYWETDSTMVIDSAEASTAGDIIITLNGEPIQLRENFNHHVILTSDNLLVDIETHSGTSLSIIYSYMDSDGVIHLFERVLLGTTVTIEYNKAQHTLTLEYNEVFIELYASFVFSVSNTQNYTYVNNVNIFPNMYMSDEVIKNNSGGIISVYSVDLTVNDVYLKVTIISDMGGTRILWDQSLYAGTLKAELVLDGLTLVDGTTDIYTGGAPRFIITAENGDIVTPSEIVPSRSFVIGEVTGHSTSGILYTLYGILPVFMLLGVLLVIVNSFVNVRGRESYSSGDDYDNF